MCGGAAVVGRSCDDEPVGSPVVVAWADPAALTGLRDPRDPVERSRALLRWLVARQTGCRAEDVLITARCPDCGGPHGQPSAANAPQLGLSLARTTGRVLAAVAPCPVGVDIEALTPAAFVGVERVALTTAEQRLLATASAEERTTLLARMWVRKEALLKLHGDGLRRDPATVSSGLAEPNTNARFVELDVGPGYVAAAAIEQPLPVQLIAATELLSRTATA